MLIISNYFIEKTLLEPCTALTVSFKSFQTKFSNTFEIVQMTVYQRKKVLHNKLYFPIHLKCKEKKQNFFFF